MSKLAQILENAGVDQTTMLDIVKALMANPLEAMSKVQALNLSQEVLQEIMSTVMTDKNAIDDLANQLGLSKDELDNIKKQIPPTP